MEQSTLSDSTRMPAAQVETRDPSQEAQVTALLTAPAGIMPSTPAADPIFAAIEKAHALHAVERAAYAVCGELPDAAPEWGPHDAAYRAWFDHIDNVLMATVPTTAVGCVALARFAVDFCAEEGVPLSQATTADEVDNIVPLRLIAQCPALAGPATRGEVGGDPVFAAIEAHAAARESFSATVNASDHAWVAQHGGDTSDAAMAPAEAARDAASDAEDAAWDALLLVRPTTMAGVLSLIQHLGRWAPEHEGIPQGGGLQPVFAAILSGLGHALAGGEDLEPVDWHNPPPGFTPWPLIEPFGFRRILDTVEDELRRLHGIAFGEYERRTRNLRKYLSEEDWQAQDRSFRESLRLSALAAAVDLDSDGARALAALDASTAMPAGSIGTAPVEAQAEALADAIEKLWPEWAALNERDWEDNSPEAEHRCAAMQERRMALLAAAEALPAAPSRAVRYAKALALAWLDQVDTWTYGRPLSDYTTDGRLVLSIEASLKGAPAWTGEDAGSHPKPAERPKPAEPDHEDIARALHRAVDLKALDIKDLSHLAFWTESLMTMASGLSYRGGTRPLGRFFDQISGALSDVAGRAQDELRARTPADAMEREYRTKTIALPVIENGDADELESLIADLQIEVAYLRQPMNTGVAR